MIKPPFIVAEISANHGGSLDLAISLIGAAAKAGADAVKFQCYIPDELTIDCRGDHFTVQSGPWAGRNLYELYAEAGTPPEWIPRLFEAAEVAGIKAFSSAFSPTGFEYLSELNCPIMKVAASEARDPEIVSAAASHGVPVIVSVNSMLDASVAEMATRRTGIDPENVFFLWCPPGYPQTVNVASILGGIELLNGGALRGRVGFSDHTPSEVLPSLAVSYGAVVIEKHLTFDVRSIDGSFSMTPDRFARMADNARETYAFLEARQELQTQPPQGFARSLHVVADMKKGEPFTRHNVASIRPSGGLLPSVLPSIIGQRAAHDLPRGKPLQHGDINGP